LLKELEGDTDLAWHRAETKEKREDLWQLSRAVRKLGLKFETLFREAKQI